LNAALKQAPPAVKKFTELEGWDAHGNSAEIRTKQVTQKLLWSQSHFHTTRRLGGETIQRFLPTNAMSLNSKEHGRFVCLGLLTVFSKLIRAIQYQTVAQYFYGHQIRAFSHASNGGDDLAF
jgi:hypothetical protein